MKPNQWQKAFELKALPRAGWIRKGIKHPESVAAHSWGLSMLCLEYAPRMHPKLNLEKVLKLALTHDVPEVLAGDITPHDGISKAQKQYLELNSAKSILNSSMFKLWLEYEKNESPEAKFVHAMDKIDMALQAMLYQSQVDTTEFLRSAWQNFPKEWRWIWYELSIDQPSI